MQDLFSTPIRTKKVRKGIYAYQYSNMNVNIDGQLYSMYSLTDAIAKYRRDFPLKSNFTTKNTIRLDYR